jgi:hypothetical protein
MEIIRMTSKSGKTKYFGLQHNNQKCKVQSRTKAIDILRFADAKADFELVKGNQHHRLACNGQDLGRISKKDYILLKNICKGETKHVQPQAGSDEDFVTIDASRIQVEILGEGDAGFGDFNETPHVLSGRRGVSASGSPEIRGTEMARYTSNVHGVETIFEKLDRLDSSLRVREASPHYYDRGIAEVQRGQLRNLILLRELHCIIEQTGRGIAHLREVALPEFQRACEESRREREASRRLIEESRRTLDRDIEQSKRERRESERERAAFAKTLEESTRAFDRNIEQSKRERRESERERRESERERRESERERAVWTSIADAIIEQLKQQQPAT